MSEKSRKANRDRWSNVACPKCGAPPGVVCQMQNPKSKRMRKSVHRERMMFTAKAERIASEIERHTPITKPGFAEWLRKQ